VPLSPADDGFHCNNSSALHRCHHIYTALTIIITTTSTSSLSLSLHYYPLQRDRRVWTKKVKYDVRKNFADSRIRVKGRFVKKEDEENMMRDLLDI